MPSVTNPQNLPSKARIQPPNPSSPQNPPSTTPVFKDLPSGSVIETAALSMDNPAPAVKPVTVDTLTVTPKTVTPFGDTIRERVTVPGVRGVMNRMAQLRFVFGVYTQWGKNGELWPEKVAGWMKAGTNIETLESSVRLMLGSNVANLEWAFRVTTGLAVFEVLRDAARQ